MKISKFDSVIFDVDSTLVTIEGLDFLAGLKGKGRQIKKITVQSMNGDLSMREAMEAKMKVISPSFNDLTNMGRAYIENITFGAEETIAILRKNKIKVWIVTGNFQPAVGMLAKFLNIPKSRVITNKIFFNNNNSYLNFDIENPLSNNGGKARIVTKYKSEMKRSVFVGDGSTDLETQGFVDLFIGFGGVIKRPNIEQKANVYVNGPITSILKHILKT